MNLPSRKRIGVAAFISACLLLTLSFLRGEMLFTNRSREIKCPLNNAYSLKVYTSYFSFGFPGQGSDVPCYVVLCRKGWRVSGGWVDMLQLVTEVQWGEKSVRISPVFEMDYDGRKIIWGDKHKN